MNAAVKTAFELVVSTHAIEKRLAAESAEHDEVSAALASRTETEAVIRDELENSIEMTPEARRIFIHPGREAVLGLVKPAEHFNRSGRRVQPANHRRNESGYFWSGDVVYVVDHDVLVTAIIPDANQVETLFRVMPEARKLDSRRRSIVKETGELKCFDEPVSQVYAREQARPKTIKGMHFKREPPPTAKWLAKEGAAWLVLIVDDDEKSNEHIKRAMARIREEKKADSSLTVHIEDADSRSIKTIRQKLSFARDFRVKDLPEVPWVEWRKCSDEIPNTARKWWVEMLDVGQAQGKLVCVVTPETARSILEIASGSSDAAWRRDRDATKSGRLLKIRCLTVATSIERSTF